MGGSGFFKTSHQAGGEGLGGRIEVRAGAPAGERVRWFSHQPQSLPPADSPSQAIAEFVQLLYIHVFI